MKTDIQELLENYKNFYVRRRNRAIFFAVMGAVVPFMTLFFLNKVSQYVSFMLFFIGKDSFAMRTLYDFIPLFEIACIAAAVIIPYVTWGINANNVSGKDIEEILDGTKDDFCFVKVLQDTIEFAAKRYTIADYSDDNKNGGIIAALSLTYKDSHCILSSIYGKEGHACVNKIKIEEDVDDGWATRDHILLPDKIKLPYMSISFHPGGPDLYMSYLVPYDRNWKDVVRKFADVYRKIVMDVLSKAMDEALRSKKVIRGDILNRKTFYPYFMKDTDNIDGEIKDDIAALDSFMQPIIEERNERNAEILRRYIA